LSADLSVNLKENIKQFDDLHYPRENRKMFKRTTTENTHQPIFYIGRQTLVLNANKNQRF